MRYSDLKTAIESQWAMPGGNLVSYLVLGKPGGGKSALARDITSGLGIDNPEKIVEFNPSLRDPVDVMGTPHNSGEYTRWVPPSEFWRLRQGQGRCALIIEEMTDAQPAMQNPMCRIVHDRHAGDLRLSDELFIIATGNRTEDKSGASRLTTKLGNRLRVHHFEENLDDWTNWALNAGIDPKLIQFLRFKPKLLSDFDPNRPFGINPTPRAWERVNRISTALKQDLFFHEVAGDVGEGAATEYIAFRKLYESLISVEEVLAAPKTVKIPTELAAQYAITGSLAHAASPNNIDRMSVFVERLRADFGVMFWVDASKVTPKLKSTREFIKWASSANNVIFG